MEGTQGGAGRASPDVTGFRTDIEGLRGWAILLVVLFHARTPWVPGGFVGVDAFFVISGFLITGSMMREADRTGHVELAAFWSRRVRRLLPAAVAVFFVTWAAAAASRSVLALEVLASQLLTALTYSTNIYQAFQATDYFGAEAESNPFLHAWSLAIEEQFYLVWPILFALGVGRRFTGRTVVLAVAGAVGLASLAACAWATARGTPWAYYSLPTRAWEFCAGAALVAQFGRSAPGRGPASAAVLCGLAALLGSAIWLDGRSPFPFPGALASVAGTLALLWGGGAGHLAGEVLLGNRVFRWLGKISYSWYLTHWPVLVLARELAPDAGPWLDVAGVALGLILGGFVHHAIELPLMSNPNWLEPRRVVGLVAVPIALGAMGLVGTREYVELRLEASSFLRELQAARERLDTATQDRSENVCSLASDPECTDSEVFIVGDSHSRHWAPAIGMAALARGQRVGLDSHGNCPLVPVRVAKAKSTESQGCIAARKRWWRRIEEHRPRVVVSSAATYVDYVLPGEAERGSVSRDRGARAWGDGMRELTSRLDELGVRLVWVLDVPGLPRDGVECLAAGGSPLGCGLERRAWDVGFIAQREAEIDALQGLANVVDPVPAVCPGGVCLAAVGDRVVYVDRGHLDSRYVTDLAHLFEEALAP